MLDVYAKSERQKPPWRILQERRSLLVTTGDMYENWLHGIQGVLVDEEVGEEGIVNWGLVGSAEFEEGRIVRETRVSLTFRDVLKVKKLGRGLAFLGK